jgi:hypothetical protein
MYHFVQTDLILIPRKAGQVLKLHSAAAVNEMIASIQAYNDSVKTAKWLVHPLAQLHSPEIPTEHADEVCRTCWATSGIFLTCRVDSRLRSLRPQNP